MQHTKEKVGRYGASLLPTLYPRAGDRVTGIARASPVNIALVKVFAGWPAYSVASLKALRGPSAREARPRPSRISSQSLHLLVTQVREGRSPSSVYTCSQLCLSY